MTRTVSSVNINTDPPTVGTAQNEYEHGNAQFLALSDHTHDFAEASHPNLASHDSLGLATDAELQAHVDAANPHPNYATDGDLAAHVAAADPHTQYALATETLNTDYLVGTASGDLSAEIVVGTTPGGELGGTWASPTVDASHSGSTHAATQAAAEATASSALGVHAGAADPHTGYRLESADHSHASTGLQGGQIAYSNLSGTPAAERAAASTAPAAIGTAAVGVGVTDARADHVHATGAGVPSTQAFGDAAATGTGPAAAMTDHKHAWPALGTTAAAIGTSAGGSAVTPSKSDHVHATGAGAPVASAMGDVAATGTGPAAAMTDHRHARSTITRKEFLYANTAKLDSGTAANLGSTPDLTAVVALADAATQGCIWSFMVPSDWVSGAITLQPVWSPGATDGVAHTVRWNIKSQTVAAGVTVTAAGTAVLFTGASSARTIGVVVYDTATSTTLTPAAAGDLFRFTIQRIGADAADSYVGVVNLLGVIVSYTANS